MSPTVGKVAKVLALRFQLLFFFAATCSSLQFASDIEYSCGQEGTQLQLDNVRKHKPFRWFHIPKAGTSLANSLLHLPEMCRDLPCDACLNSNTRSPMTQFVMKYGNPGQKNGNSVCKHDFQGKWGWHNGVDEEWEDAKGRLVGMFRQPEQRIISAYHCPYRDDHSWPFRGNQSDPSLVEFAEFQAGCVVKMLTRSSDCLDKKPVLDDEVEIAKTRLRDGYAFVGITEEWKLSMCLLHAKFGGDCKAFEFANVRPGPKHTDTPYDTQELDGFTDRYDGVLYQEALRIFYSELKKYGVTNESCDKFASDCIADE